MERGIVTGSSPLPTGLPSTNNVRVPGDPFPFMGSGLPVGANSGRFLGHVEDERNMLGRSREGPESETDRLWRLE